MSSNKVIKLSEIEPWKSSDFKSLGRDKAAELFMGVAQVPPEWSRVYFMSDEDFQIAMHCVNASIEAATELNKPVSTPPDNSVTVSFRTS